MKLAENNVIEERHGDFEILMLEALPVEHISARKGHDEMQTSESTYVEWEQVQGTGNCDEAAGVHH